MSSKVSTKTTIIKNKKLIITKSGTQRIKKVITVTTIDDDNTIKKITETATTKKTVPTKKHRMILDVIWLMN